jgi:hypothetical protein
MERKEVLISNIKIAPVRENSWSKLLTSILLRKLTLDCRNAGLTASDYSPGRGSPRDS